MKNIHETKNKNIPLRRKTAGENHTKNIQETKNKNIPLRRKTAG